MAVLTAGDIYLQVKGFIGTKKAKKYGILYGKSPDSHSYLALFDSYDDYQKYNQHDKKVDFKRVDLRFIKKISNETINGSKGVEYHIEVQTKKEKIVLMVDSEQDSQTWSTKFNSLCSEKQDETSTSSVVSTYDVDDDDDDDDESVTVNAMYGGAADVTRFEVDVERTDLAELCNIVGKRSIMVTPTCIAFENTATRQVDFTFQIGWLRRFGKKDSRFTFEVGRSCPNGAGSVKVKTESAKTINDLVKRYSNSRGETVTPAQNKGISEAKSSVQHVIEKKIEDHDTAQKSISGPALHMHRRHPGLGAGPKLIPLQNQKTDEDSPPPVLEHELKNRNSTKSVGGDSVNSVKSGSIKNGPASENFTKKLENQIAEKEKSKDRESKKKDSDRRREEKENKKREEENRKREEENRKREEENRKREEKERKEREKREEKERKERDKREEKAKKGEKKGKEKVQQPPARVPGAYEEVDIIDQTPSPKPANIRANVSHYEEPDIKHEELYAEADQKLQDEPVEYAQPIKHTNHVPCEYADVKTVKGNAWQSHGRTEDEEEHMEDYSRIKSVRDELETSAPPLPERGYEEEEEDDTYNRISLKTKTRKPAPATQNIYGTASGTKVRPIKRDIEVPEPDYEDSDSGESIHDDTYDTPDFDTYDSPIDPVKPKKPVETYEEANPKPRVSPRRVKEDALYDEVS